MVQPRRFTRGTIHSLGRLLTQSGCLIAMALIANGADSATSSERSRAVAANLAAGEFGPAIANAMSASSPSERTDLLNQVAVAQQAAGDEDAAAVTLRRLPRTDSRVRSRPTTPGLAGGNPQADFGTLMRLIRQNTPGKWEDNDGEGGTMTPYPTGVKVSPDGLLVRQSGEELTGQLAALGVQSRVADLNEDIARRSDLRMVSLTRLERSVSRRLDEGLPVPESMTRLAGLTKIKYVLVFPESKEIVLAGPACGWQYNGQGQPVSVTDGRPTLQLDDFVTVLRSFVRGHADFGCSINTRDEGVKALKDFVEKSQAKGDISDTAVRSWVRQIQQKLGRQDVVVWGIPADSRVSRVIVEADYRMKLIGVNKLQAGKDIPGYFDLLPADEQSSRSLDALRWWLTVKCDAVLHSEDKNVFEIQGSSVLCQSENQFVTAEGKHVPTGQSEPTNRLFAQNFTLNYAKLAKKDLVFADAQNVFDLALCAALIRHEDLLKKSAWNLGVFAPEGAYAPASYAVPREVDSVANHRVYRGRDIVVQAAGGVRCNVMSLANDPNRNKAEPQLENVAAGAKAPQLAEGRWWWDSAK